MSHRSPGRQSSENCNKIKDRPSFTLYDPSTGKDSIRYHNLVGVEKRVFRNVGRFMENKKGADDLFDRLNTSILNEYLNGLMPGLTAKVFRTYNASITLQEQLNELTDADDNVVAKVNSFTILQPGLITIITLFCRAK